MAKNREYEQRSNRVNMFDTLDVYVNEKRGKVSPDQIKDYNTLKKHLTNFKAHSSQPVTFRNLNLKFYNEFMTSQLSNKKIYMNTSQDILYIH